MPKGALEESRATTSAIELRDLVCQTEIKVASLRHQNVDVETLLKERDALEDMLSGAEQEGLDVRSERGRAQAVDGVLSSKARRMMRLLADKGGFGGARERNAPPEGHWWWYLDVFVHQRVKRTITRTVIITVCVAVLVLGANYVLNKLYGPSPSEHAFSELTYQAERALNEGDAGKAISAYEQAVAINPADAEIQATLGVLYELNGRAADATAAFAVAEQYSDGRVGFLFTQARAYLMLGQVDRALEIAELAVTTDDSSPFAFYVLAEALEAKGDRTSAAQAFDIAAQLAFDQGQDVMYAIARERQAVLITGGR